MDEQEFGQLHSDTQSLPAKKLFSKLGFLFAGLLLLVQVVQVVLMAALKNTAPAFLQSVWGSWTLIGVSMYLVCLPVCLLAMKRIPKQTPAGEKTPFSFEQMVTLFIICLGATYIGNYISLAINAGLAALKGAPVTNPLEFTGGGSILATVIFGVVLSPIVEEIIFRKLLIDRIEQYGEGLCILTSGWFFGLYHGNLSQLIYAVALGCIFAFIYVRSGRLRYSIILHVAINACGLVIFPQLVAIGDLALTAMVGLVLIAIIIASVILFISKVKKVHLYAGASGLTKAEKSKLLLLSPGCVVYELLVLVLIVLVVLA